MAGNLISRTGKTLPIMIAMILAITAAAVLSVTENDGDMALGALTDYDANDVAVINSVIANNGLGWTPDDPDNWPGCAWDASVPKRLISLDLSLEGIYGVLDVTGLSALTELNCDFNSITGLNVSGLGGLQNLYCSNNPSLASLDITGCTGLISLSCAAVPLLPMPDLTIPTALEKFGCSNNGLTALTVTGTSLWFLDCSENALTVLDVSGLTMLRHLDCSYNLLTGLDLTGLTQLNSLICNYNLMTGTGDLIGLPPGVSLTFSPQVISISAISGVTVPVVGATPVTVITETAQFTGTVSWLPAATTFGYGTEYTARIVITPKTGFTLMRVPSGFFTVEGAANVTFTTGNLVTALFPATVSYHGGDMAVINNIITSNGLNWTPASPAQLADGKTAPSDWTGVTWRNDGTHMRIVALQISDKDLRGSLEVTQLTALELLYCHNNAELTSVNASGLAALEDLGCSYGALTSLNVSGCAALVEIDCTYNSIVSLNVSGLAALEILNCYFNEISSLNLSGCAALAEIDCSYNKLTSLNVTGLDLRFLDCSYNYMSDESKVIGFEGTWDGVNFIFDPQNSLPAPGGIDIMVIAAIAAVAIMIIAAAVYVFVIRPRK